MEKIEKEKCPVCGEKALELIERETEVPYFGKVFLYSMTCGKCRYHKADVEVAEKKEPCRCSIKISSEQDMKIRIVKSSEAVVKIPHITTIEPGASSQGYVTNVEGLLNRVKHEIEFIRDNAEDDGDKQKAKNLLKKLINVMWGKGKLKIIIEDPSGNSAIISEKAKTEKL